MAYLKATEGIEETTGILRIMVSFSETGFFKSLYSEIPLPGLDRNETEFQNTETKICLYSHTCAG